MATTVTVLQQNPSPAFKGQAAIVTLNVGDSLTILPRLKIGQQCEVSSSSNLGTIASVDYKGNTFKVSPAQPNLRFDSSSTPGILNTTETITITL